MVKGKARFEAWYEIKFWEKSDAKQIGPHKEPTCRTT